MTQFPLFYLLVALLLAGLFLISISIWHTLERSSPGADLLLSPQPDARLTARFVKTGPVPPQMHHFTSQLQMKPVSNYTVLVDRGRPLNKEPVSCDSRSVPSTGVEPRSFALTRDD